MLMLNNIPDTIYFKDLEGKFIKNSVSRVHCLGVDGPEQLISKREFDFLGGDAQLGQEDYKYIIRTGDIILNKVQKIISKMVKCYGNQSPSYL